MRSAIAHHKTEIDYLFLLSQAVKTTYAVSTGEAADRAISK